MTVAPDHGWRVGEVRHRASRSAASYFHHRSWSLWLRTREPTIEERTPYSAPFVNAHDRRLPPSRQHPSFVLPPVSRHLETGGRVQSQAEGTGGLARLVLPAAGGNLRHRLQGEDPPDTEPGSSHRHSGCSGCLASDPGDLPV